MKKIRNALLLVFITACSIVHAQNPALKVFEQWRTENGSQNTFYKCDTKTIPGTTNSIVCGATLNGSGNYDLFVEQLNGTGGAVWMYQWDGTGQGDDIATAIDVDGSGNVYLTGTYFENSSDSFNVVTLMLDNTGSLQWLTKYNGAASGVDASSCIFYDASAPGIFVGGTEWNGVDYDFLVMMLSTSGSQNWASLYDFSAGDDAVGKITVNSKGAGIAGGAYQTGTADFKYAVMNFDMSGNFSTLTTGGGTTWGMNRLTDLALDDTGNVYVTGFVSNGITGYDMRTMKLDTLLQIVWSNDYDAGYNLDDEGTGIALDSHNNVVICGTSRTVFNGLNYSVIKYNNAGAVFFSDSYNGAANGNDSATAIVINPNDTDAIYVTGYSYDSASAKNYYTIRYDGMGNRLWEIEMNSWRNGDDIATDIAIDTVGAIVVAGQSDFSNSARTYTTVRYLEMDVTIPPDTVVACQGFLYEENRGQLFNTDSLVDTTIKYYCKSTWPATYFNDTALSYIWARIDTIAATDDTLHRIDMKFVGANDTRVLPMNKQTVYYNYLLGQLDFPLETVPLYAELFYPEVYSKVDVMYSSNGVGMKHSFIIRAGGNATDIEMEFAGADSIKIVNDTLMVYSALGVLKQRQATAFEIDNNGNRIPLAWQPDYTINGSGNVEFTNIGAYTIGRTLVFECDWGPQPAPGFALQTLEWSTYVGTSNNDVGRDVVADATTNAAWLTGSTAINPFAGQIGATVLAFRGGVDAFVARFSSVSVSQWVSYIGGSSTDDAYSIAKDGGGNTFVVGSTQSSDFIDGVSAGIDYSWGGGGIDAFFVALNNAGQIICDSYIGSAGTEVAYSVAAQKGPAAGSLDIFIVGYNESGNSGFPFVTNGGYNQAYSGGSADGFIVQLDETYNNVWTTFFGGSQNEYFKDVAIRAPNNNPVIVGVSENGASMDYTCNVPATVGEFPLCDGGVGNYSAPPAGLTDVIIEEFDNTNKNLIWSTYFGGSDYEGFYQGLTAAVAVVDDNVYVVSDTRSDNDLPVTSSVFGNSYNQPYGSSTGGANWFIARFDPFRHLSWCTFFGGDGNLNFPTSICGDANNNVYVTGFTRPISPTSLPNYCSVPPTNEYPICNYSGVNYMEVNASISQRSFIVAFDATDNLKWSTLFAQGPNSEGQGIFATPTKLFLAGRTDGPYSLVDFNTASGLDYYVPSFQGVSDAGISRFDIAHIVSIGPEMDDSSGFEVYPNPASDFVTLQLDNPAEEGSKIRVVDISGRVVMSQNVNPMEQTYSLDVSDLSNGMYFIEIVSNRGITSQKFIKNK